MYQVSIDHKEQLAKIEARQMIRAHMLNAIPTDGSAIATWEVRDYTRAMVGGIMDYMIDETTGGLDGFITNESYFIGTQKRYINRGGSQHNTDPELAPRHWAFTPDGYERMRQDIPNFDELIQLAEDVMEHPELVDDPTDQDADVATDQVWEDPSDQGVEYEEIHSEEGQFPIRDADVATNQDADIQAIKDQLAECIKAIVDLQNSIAEVLDRPIEKPYEQPGPFDVLERQPDGSMTTAQIEAPIQPKRMPYMQNR